MNIKKIVTDKNFVLLTYKLAHDALFLMLLALAGMLVSEGILPGFISAHISFVKVIVVIFILLSFIALLGHQLDIAFTSSPMQKNKLVPLLLIFSFLLIGNSMLKFPFWENLLTTLATLLVFFLFYQLIFFPKKEDE